MRLAARYAVEQACMCWPSIHDGPRRRLNWGRCPLRVRRPAAGAQRSLLGSEQRALAFHLQLWSGTDG